MVPTRTSITPVGIIDRYKVKTDKASGIVDDTIGWCDEHDDASYSSSCSRASPPWRWRGSRSSTRSELRPLRIHFSCQLCSAAMQFGTCFISIDRSRRQLVRK